MVGRCMPLVIFLALTATWATTGPPYAMAHEKAIINFFLHDYLLNVAGPSSAFTIIPPLDKNASTTQTNQTFFGSLVVFDDSITVDPDPSSLEIGRGRGFYLFDQITQAGAPGLEFSWTAEFNAESGYGNGSTLIFKGFDRVFEPVREIAIVGGTGTFRLARGWAVLTTHDTAPIGVANINVTANVFYGL